MLYESIIIFNNSHFIIVIKVKQHDVCCLVNLRGSLEDFIHSFVHSFIQQIFIKNLNMSLIVYESAHGSFNLMRDIVITQMIPYM